MKKFFWSCFIFFALFFWNNSYTEAATIRLSSPKIELELAPGGSYSGEIIAENPAEDEVKIKIYLEDWIYLPGGTGDKKFTPIGSTPYSASKWITFSPAQDSIKPFGRVIARYTIAVPQNAKGGYYSALFFETSLGSVKEEEGMNVLVAARIGALFFVQVKGTVNRQGAIKSAEIVPPQGNKPMEILTTFENTGNVDITLGGKFLIMDASGKIQGRGELKKIYTFPNTTENSKTQWVGRLSNGSYQLLITYDLGKGKNLVEEKALIIQ